MQGQRSPNPSLAAASLAAVLALWMAEDPWAAGAPTLWGYGVKTCGAFLAVAPAAGEPADLGDSDYLRYREWLAGLVTGLNLATGTDVLGGAELDAALTRIRGHCKEHPEEDFFNASLALLKNRKPAKENKK